LPAGILAAVRRNSIFDHGVMATSLTGYSMPIFWWGLLLILFFSVQLGWTPVSGRIAVQYFIEPETGFLLIDSLRAGDTDAFWSALHHLILPAIVLGTVPLAVIARMTRSAMLEVLGEDYIRTARAKGLSRFRVVGLHALRNALIPSSRSSGCRWACSSPARSSPRRSSPGPASASGSSRPSAGATIRCCRAACCCSAAIVMMVNLLVDVTYGVINPRIRR
jgi:dipeptide transport system permease protein